MRIYRNFDHIPPTPLVACIGFFDGVHLGHRYLLNLLKQRADASGYASAVVTFANHPRTVISPDTPVALIDTAEEKSSLLAACGVDVCLLLDFTPQLMETSAEDFIALLAERGHIKTLLVGYDHRFGHNRAETFEDYCRYGRELGIHIMQATAYTQEQDKVSSSAIRRALLSGEVSTATKYLGYPYFLQGTIVSGYQVGRKIGFPTANLQVDFSNKLIPAIGVYAVRVSVNGQNYKGMLNIGHRPTINNGTDLSIEVHILDFEGDIYNQPMHIEFVDFLRSEAKVHSIDELVLQIQKDKEETLKVFQ